MAAAPRKKLSTLSDAKANDALLEEAENRLNDCRSQKADVEQDIREAYFLTRPRLSRQVLSSSAPQSPPKDSDALATGLGAEVVEDFATEVINAFMPPHVNWAVSEAAEGVPDALWQQVKDAAGAADGMVFKAIRASNFDAELAKALIPDAAVGTVGMLIDDYTGHEPLCTQHIPLRELEINVGPYGTIDDRFVVRWVRGRKVAATFRGYTLPQRLRDQIAKRPEDWVECRWGFWRDWGKPDDVVWKRIAMAGGELIDAGETVGEGSCPLIVGRFSPDSLYAFGNGPTLEALPHLRIIDSIATATQDRTDIAISPPIAYPDDGVMNFEQGIRSGMAYPKRPGSRNEIEPLYFTGDPNLGFYTLADLEKSVRRKHFADYPDQQGKTPPTATQWLDEMVKSQRRIGTPGQAFWREFPAEIFLRFRYLQAARGRIDKLTADGKVVATRPRNPATKAQENQEVQVASQLLSLAKSFFPVTSNAAIDEMETIKNIKDKLGDQLVVLRDKGTVEKFVNGLMARASLGGGGGAPGGGDGAPPQPGAAGP